MSTKSRTPTPAASQRRSIVRRVADAIRRDALESAEGALLGSEDDLIVRYAVSRPTLRQAALVVREAELWLARFRLMRRGTLRLVRWHAIATGAPLG